MGSMGVVLLLLVACSLLQGSCWAGPIDTQLIPPRNLEKPGSTSHDVVQDPRLERRDTTIHESISPVLRLRSTTPATNNSSSMWAVTAVVGTILLICLLVVVVVIIRRNKKRLRKAASDEELGFGRHPQAQPDIPSPPKTYDGMSRSPPAKMEKSEVSPNTRKPPPPPLLTISPPEESGQKPKRVPAPRFLPSPTSPRLIGLPPSPRLIGLPPSPRLAASPRTQQSSSGLHLSEPQRDMPSSPRGLPSPSLGTPSANDGHALEVPLSAGGLERMITTMERELEENSL
ncbi:hypothetical protein FPV67DRAFT_1448141 [Lyophyllum atratum]|nr:hypothetical protein FPV67DRAFT_1448141 [Lyophyllum atratum]